MTNILQTLAVAATLITFTVAASSSAISRCRQPISGPVQKSEPSLFVCRGGKWDTGPIPAGRLRAWGASAPLPRLPLSADFCQKEISACVHGSGSRSSPF